jgi:hypothetical protein
MNKLISEKTYPHSGIGRWMKEKWKDQYGKSCGSGEAYKKGKYPKCRPSKKVSGKTPETWGEMTKGEKSKAVRRKQKVRGGVSSHLNEEENKPTNPELWSRVKAEHSGEKHSLYKMARLARIYKSRGGGWRSVDESVESRVLAFHQNLMEKSAAWQRKEGKDPEGGLNRKGVASYRRENPGSNLKMAVTTEPSKLKKGSKSWKRRKSFCARMGGMKGAMEKNGKPTRKALALRKWNCESHTPESNSIIQLLQEKCWPGYQQNGFKKKGSKSVPNCVKVNEEVVNKDNKGKMTKAMKSRRDRCAKSKPKGIKPIKGNDTEENAYHRYCTYREFAKHKKK